MQGHDELRLGIWFGKQVMRRIDVSSDRLFDRVGKVKSSNCFAALLIQRG